MKYRPLNILKALPIFILLNFLCLSACSFAQQNQMIENLKDNPKIMSSEALLGDFGKGKKEIRIIVTLRDPVEGRQLKKMKDERQRKKLQEDVNNTQNMVIQALDAKAVRDIKRFTYVFGFAASAFLDGITHLVNNPEVVLIRKEMKLSPN